MKTPEEQYKLAQKIFEESVPVGTRVRVVRSLDKDDFWFNRKWTKAMNNCLGETLKVDCYYCWGVRLRSEHIIGTTIVFPFFVLKTVPEQPPAPKPFSMLGWQPVGDGGGVVVVDDDVEDTPPTTTTNNQKITTSTNNDVYQDTLEKISVMQAFVEGKRICYANWDDLGCVYTATVPKWKWDKYKYWVWVDNDYEIQPGDTHLKTQSGKCVRIYATKCGEKLYSVHGAIEDSPGDWRLASWTSNGKSVSESVQNYDDIIIPKED